MKETLVGRTRWRKFAYAMVPATAAVVVMFTGLSNGAIAASFAVSGHDFQVSASSMDVDGFAQYGGVDVEVNGAGNKDKMHAVAIAAAKSAKVRDLCQSVIQEVPVIGKVTIKITAGKDADVIAENLFLDMTQLKGDAVFTDIQIGQDASTLSKGGPTGKGAVGGFGQQATRAQITNVKQVAWGVNAGTFKLTGMHLQVLNGVHPCFTE
ncbi:DUF6230 family protein [Longispora albida]|uniref:DUF6230 family protein n=1 Tax=Longispora albida TaxID=203523 RepID=UPI0003644A44|nr:DUF6230 family protein [Longispora albida]